MNDPVASPIEPTIIEQRVSSAVEEGQILDEGLDLDGYINTHGSPYVADYFGLRDLYKTNEEINEQVEVVTKYVRDKTENGVVYASKALLDEMSGGLNLQDKDSGIYKLKRVVDLIRAKSQLEVLDVMRKKALADIESMV